MRADTRDEPQVKAFVDATVARYGRLYIAFTNAGIDKPPPAIAETDAASFDDLISTNLRGVFLGMKHEMPHLIRTKGTTREVAELVLFLASPQASYISGQIAAIDGGGLA